MLTIDEKVSHGIIFLRVDGKLNSKSFTKFNNQINYLLYNQGLQYFVIDLNNTKIEKNIFERIQSKLIEIFLNCGQVALCGIKNDEKNKIGYTAGKLFYINEEREAFKYLWM